MQSRRRDRQTGSVSDVPEAVPLAGPRVRLSPLQPAHGERLRELHAAPEVRRWWNEPSPTWTFDPDERTRRLAVLLGGEVAGFVQWYAETDPDYRHAGLDLFLDPAVHGRGLGREVVTLVCTHLVDDLGHHRLVIDPDVDNRVAVACYAAVGFRPVGVMRRYSRSVDGTWHDGLLMDLLADELDRSALGPAGPPRLTRR
jgi:aminoglycoside 6'-N-acetyltransferase